MRPCLFYLPLSVFPFHATVNGRGSFWFSSPLTLFPLSLSLFQDQGGVPFPPSVSQASPPSVFQGNLNLSLPLMHSLSFFKHLTPGTLSDIFSSTAYHLKPRLPDLFPTSSLISPLLVMTDPLRANILTQAAHAQV